MQNNEDIVSGNVIASAYICHVVNVAEISEARMTKHGHIKPDLFPFIPILHTYIMVSPPGLYNIYVLVAVKTH